MEKQTETFPDLLTYSLTHLLTPIASSLQTAKVLTGMDIFNSRISRDEAAAMFAAAQSSELLNGASSAIFHHLGLMRSRISELRAAFPGSTLHAVAIKANPIVEVLREVVRAGAGLEAASIEEVHLALAAGCPPDHIVFDSPAKTRDEIQQALRWGVCLNADNLDELPRIAEARESCGSASPVGVRVNPMVGGGTIEQTSVADEKSKFGVPLKSDRQQIIAAFERHEWLTGLHLHVGSQGCSLALLVEAAGRIADLRREIITRTGRNVANVDIGGGLSTVYRAGQTAPTPGEYRVRLEDRAPDLFSSDVRLMTEFGRAIHANCGIAFARVEYVKAGRCGDRMAVIHLGADFLLRPVYRPADWQHEFYVLNRGGAPKSGKETPVTIVGPLCFAGDVLARDVLLPPVNEGDWIVIRDVGAYTLSMWSRHCSRGIPVVLGYDPQKAASLRILRRAETPGDVVRFWSDSSVASIQSLSGKCESAGDSPHFAS
jgi:diaminopimelate decarboxylase